MKTLATLALTVLLSQIGFSQNQKVTINYPTRSGASWPLYIAKEGGYYAKYGLDVNIIFGVHPSGVAMLVSGEGQMVNHSLEQGMQAAVKDGQFAILGSPSYKGFFSLMAKSDVIKSVKDLKGKRIAVGQVGDAPYNYTNALLKKYGMGPRDVTWIPVGTDVSGRAASLESGRADATLLTAPANFRMEEKGYRIITNLQDHDDIFIATGYLFRKSLVAADPTLPEKIIKAHTEAIKRFYEDRAFAIKAYQVYDKQSDADLNRIYDAYSESNGFERVPYLLNASVQAVIGQQSDKQLSEQMKAFDFKKTIDNRIVDRLVKEGYFEQVFGPSAKAEVQKKAKLIYK